MTVANQPLVKPRQRAGDVDLRSLKKPTTLPVAPGTIICRDGRVYSFAKSLSLPSTHAITKLAIGAYAEMLSTNDDIESRRTTNKGLHKELNYFLDWAGKQTELKAPCAFNQRLMKSYQDYLLANFAQATAWTRYAIVLRTVKTVIRQGHVRLFPIPPNVSQDQALANGRGGETIVNILPDGYKITAGKAVDEDAVARMISACLQLIAKRHERFRLGLAWKQEVETTELSPSILAALNATPTDQKALLKLSRQDLAKFGVMLCWKGYGGVLPTLYDGNGKGIRKDALPEGRLIGTLIESTRKGLRRRGEAALSTDDLSSYCIPDTEFLSLHAPLFAVAGVNPESIPKLRCDMLRPDPSDVTIASIIWDKPRAGGEKVAGPLMVGAPGNMTLPRLWNEIVELTKPIRQHLLNADRDRLLVARNCRQGGVFAIHQINTLWLAFRRAIMASDEPEHHVLKEIVPQLTAKLARTTGINITNRRLGRDFTKTALLQGRAGIRALDNSYLNNPETKAALDEQMFGGQMALERWVREGRKIVAKAADAIIATTDVDQTMAGEILAEHFNTGFGVSLANEHAIVVDTPLNCLRMIQWLRRLKESRDRMLIENPERWCRFFEPQVQLFSESIEDFPRATRMEANRMDPDYQLPFPEIF